ncbi:fatty acyl-CoA reductase 2-like isoform X2 [Chironomus tepperi]|uniref:fatty acyl-CoA reductase 2-like isoform X2 n=1 Tax=Chironomus tepperi TaxID=113505 RepID=UPI00391F3517
MELNTFIEKSRKGVSSSDRIDTIINCKLFNKLKASDPTAINKIHALDGDVQKLRLGLSDADVEKIKSCSIIFHCAASVRFDDPLSSAILMNTRGTLEVCKIAEKIPHLKALVHVSTSFIQPKIYGSDEIFYPADVDWRKFINYAETIDDGMLDALEKKLTDNAPNTYTFTKHLSEQVCKYYRDTKKLPIVIYRPSIIAGSESEPLPGWLDNLNGPFSYCFTAILGILHASMVDGFRKLDYISVDLCVKGMIVAAWKTWKEHQTTAEIPIYNATSSKKPSFYSMSWQKMHQVYPSNNSIMYMDMTHTKCIFLFWLIKIVEQIIPALIYDGLLRLTGKKPKLLKFQRIIMESEKAMLHFTLKDFKFTNIKFLDLDSAIPPHEFDDFYVSTKLSDEVTIIRTTCLNFVENMLNEDVSDFTKAFRKQKLVTYIWRTYQIGVYSYLIYLACLLFQKTFGDFSYHGMFIAE